MMNLRRIFILPLLLAAVIVVSLSGTHQQSFQTRISGFLPDTLFHGRNFFSYNNVLLSDHPSSNNTYDQQAADLVSKVSSSVVSIYGYSKTVSSGPDNGFSLPAFINSFINLPANSNAVETVQTTAGSGFFVDKNGYILTNKHVVEDLDSSYYVTLSDGTQLPANVVYRDSKYDLAILKVAGSNHTPLNLGDSSHVKVGQAVMSMGNAYGDYPNLLTAGKITALHQDIIASDEGSPDQSISDLIQTDAQLYPGDSGGPTFDINGNVMGVNVAMATNVDNVSFAIPINVAKGVISSVLHGK